MIKHNFKIGDKVKLKNPKPFPHLGTRVLIILGSDDKFVFVEDKHGSSGYFPLYPKEIDHVVKVGEQLLFQFMKGD